MQITNGEMLLGNNQRPGGFIITGDDMQQKFGSLIIKRDCERVRLERDMGDGCVGVRDRETDKLRHWYRYMINPWRHNKEQGRR